MDQEITAPDMECELHDGEIFLLSRRNLKPESIGKENPGLDDFRIPWEKFAVTMALMVDRDAIYVVRDHFGLSGKWFDRHNLPESLRMKFAG